MFPGMETSMKRRAVILLAWWFVLTVSGRVVGPFADQIQCGEIRG